MRSTTYNTLDEILDDSRVVSMSHNGLVPICWTPDRLKLLAILGCDFAKKIIDITYKIDEYALQFIDIFPNEYVKAAHNLQLSAKQTTEINDDKLVKAYIKLTNCSIKRREILIKKHLLNLSEDNFPFFTIKDESEKRKILYLNAILRACSETIYFDNHTSGGDIIGPIEYQKDKILIKTFSNMVSDCFLTSNEFQPLFKQINIYMRYSKIDAEFDMIGNYISQHDINEHLLSYCIEIISDDGTTSYCNVYEVEYIIKQYIEVLRKCTKTIDNLSYSDKIRCVIKCIIRVYEPIFSYYNIQYLINENDMNSIINNYLKNTYFSTENLFETMPYKNAIEIIINPQKKFFINN